MKNLIMTIAAMFIFGYASAQDSTGTGTSTQRSQTKDTVRSTGNKTHKSKATSHTKKEGDANYDRPKKAKTAKDTVGGTKPKK